MIISTDFTHQSLYTGFGGSRKIWLRALSELEKLENENSLEGVELTRPLQHTAHLCCMLQD